MLCLLWGGCARLRHADSAAQTALSGAPDAGPKDAPGIENRKSAAAASSAKSRARVPRIAVDDRYGTGALGPRILFHESEVVDVAPQRMDVQPMHADNAVAPSEGAESPKPSARDSAVSALEASATERRVGKSVLAKETQASRSPRSVRVWDVREPVGVRNASPLAPAEVDTQAYLAMLGIQSIYELSPFARRLTLPRMIRLTPSPPTGRGGKPVHVGRRPTGASLITAQEWEDMIQEAGRLFGLDPRFIAAMIKVESNFDPLAVSPKGAQGAMQIMPATQEQLGLADPFDARANIHAGCAFIHELLVQYGSVELALAAYNAGPKAVMKYGGIPPYAETQRYVRRVMTLWKGEHLGR